VKDISNLPTIKKRECSGYSSTFYGYFVGSIFLIFQWGEVSQGGAATPASPRMRLPIYSQILDLFARDTAFEGLHD
ncbi:hypothetical protein, partial [Sutterella wadsworthensis]|uniref:hypothetical protein n=1 Tax=Sutterella wadsworthensis TaxID=40545 RepID=UPI00265B1260